MGFFNKLFGKTEQPPAAAANKPQLDLTPGKKLTEAILECYGGIAYHKQMDFGEVVSGIDNWFVDLTKEEIAFGPHLSFKIQVIGTLAHESNTWLWAWANTKSAFPENVLQQSLELKKYGEENNLP